MDNSRTKQGSDRVNSVGNDDEEAMSITVGELAEIKEVVGRLYKKITELELTQKSDREKDRAEIAAWAQTNLIQTQLLAKQTAVIEMLTAQLKQSAQLSQQSQMHNESLREELQNLNGQLANMPKSSPKIENLELKGLKSEVVTLKSEVVTLGEALRAIPQQLERIERGQKALEARQSRMEEDSDSLLFDLPNDTNHDQSRGGGWDFNARSLLVGSVVVVSILAGLWVIWGQTKSNGERVGWSNTKLERIEKRLGVKRK